MNYKICCYELAVRGLALQYHWVETHSRLCRCTFLEIRHFWESHVYLLILQPQNFDTDTWVQKKSESSCFCKLATPNQLTLFVVCLLASLLIAGEPGDETVGKGMRMTLCICFFDMHSYQTQLLYWWVCGSTAVVCFGFNILPPFWCCSFHPGKIWWVSWLRYALYIASLHLYTPVCYTGYRFLKGGDSMGIALIPFIVSLLGGLLTTENGLLNG